MITKESHVPVPTRLADLMTHEKRKVMIQKELIEEKAESAPR
jgi:hypothetical protein